ncbi:MAG: RNA polymerase sigma factor [Mucilaginibacter sp.]
MHLPQNIAEDQLIKQCRIGSLKYQELLYKHYYGYAMGISLRYSLNRDDAMEVVNDAFIKVFNSIGSYNTEKPFKPWLRVIVVNTAIDRRRKDLKLLRNTDLDSIPLLVESVSVINNLDAQDILKLMQQLPTMLLAIFNLYEIDGYNHDEIANLLSIPASSSRVYLSRAKEKLRKIISTEMQDNGQ